MDNPKISIIIGVLNMREYLIKALESVVKQQYDNLELIIMDGGSTDGTLDVIKQYEKYITFWQTGKDKGHADACNRALDIATGQFIGFLNADDTLGDGLLSKIADCYRHNPSVELITAGVKIIQQMNDQECRILQEISNPKQLQMTLKNMLFGLPAINARFFSPAIFKRFGKFKAQQVDGSYNISNDRDFLLTLAMQGVQSAIIPECFYMYMSHENSYTFGSKNQEKIYKEHTTLAKKFLATPNITLEQKKLILKWLNKELVYQFYFYLTKLNFKYCWNILITSLREYPIYWLKQFTISSIGLIIKRVKRSFI